MGHPTVGQVQKVYDETHPPKRKQMDKMRHLYANICLVNLYRCKRLQVGLPKLLIPGYFFSHRFSREWPSDCISTCVQPRILSGTSRYQSRCEISATRKVFLLC